MEISKPTKTPFHSQTKMMTPREREIRLRLRDSFEYYAPRCLKIRTKSGAVEQMRLNAAQLYLHTKLEEQKRKTGRIRALIVKGRKQGCSTYTEGASSTR